MIEELLDHVNQPEKSPTDVFILYDIACSLYKHLQVGVHRNIVPWEAIR